MKTYMNENLVHYLVICLGGVSYSLSPGGFPESSSGIFFFLSILVAFEIFLQKGDSV